MAATAFLQPESGCQNILSGLAVLDLFLVAVSVSVGFFVRESAWQKLSS